MISNFFYLHYCSYYSHYCCYRKTMKTILTLELVHLTLRVVVSTAISNHYRSPGFVQTLHVHLVLLKFIFYFFIRDKSIRDCTFPPFEILQKHCRGLVDVMVSRSKKPPHRLVISLLHFMAMHDLTSSIRNIYLISIIYGC